MGPSEEAYSHQPSLSTERNKSFPFVLGIRAQNERFGSVGLDGRISCPDIHRASPPGEIWAGANQKVRVNESNELSWP